MAIGVWQIALILAVVVLLFGGKRLASLGRGLGDGIRNFRQGVGGAEDAAGELREARSEAER